VVWLSGLVAERLWALPEYADQAAVGAKAKDARTLKSP
jgi:hypothetical protein